MGYHLGAPMPGPPEDQPGRASRPAAEALTRVGQTIGHYRLLRLLGQGGMGAVYRAEDTRLGRSVALKLISPGRVADAGAKERFVQEARSASSLDHPNICTVHEVGESADGELFLVMAFYDGPTVADRIIRGPLPVEEAVEIARGLLRGLEAAHGSRIVHRDVKPANLIFTSRGEVKVLDFGLAKLMRGPEGASEDPTQQFLTQPGTVLGTRVYMSPEQCRGQKVDHRTDLWAAGVCLYEMLTGRVPFRAGDPVATLFAICNDEPAPLGTLRRDLPGGLEGVVRRALAKGPDRRYQSAREFLADLDLAAASPPGTGPVVRATSGSQAALPRSILVLPFANLSPAREEDYFSDGLTDEIITDLSVLKLLRVTSRTSAMQLKGTTKDIRTIGRELEVQYVLEGTVRRMGDTLRVTAKLIDAVLDTPLWAEKFSGEMKDVFDIQERISREIVQSLRLKLSSTEERRLGERPLEDVQAYEFYLRARQEVFRFTPDALERALGYLRQGIEIVGDNVLLVSAMGNAYWQYFNAGISPDPGNLAEARACAERCLELDPESPHGHRLLGLTAVKTGTIQEVVRHLKRAHELDPNDAETLFWLAVMYGFAGRARHGLPLAERLLKIDPLTPIYQVVPGFLAMMEGDFAAAPEAFLRAIRMDPSNPILRVTYGHALALLGRREEAVEAFDALERDQPGAFFSRVGQVYKSALGGRREEVLAGVTDELAALCGTDGQYSWSLAECFALVGEKARAAEWLEKAIAHGCWNYRLLAEWDPLLAGARDEPAFARALAELRPRWEGFEV